MNGQTIIRIACVLATVLGLSLGVEAEPPVATTQPVVAAPVETTESPTTQPAAPSEEEPKAASETPEEAQSAEAPKEPAETEATPAKTSESEPGEAPKEEGTPPAEPVKPTAPPEAGPADMKPEAAKTGSEESPKTQEPSQPAVPPAEAPKQAPTSAPSETPPAAETTTPQPAGTQPTEPTPAATKPAPKGPSEKELNEFQSLITAPNTPEARRLGVRRLLSEAPAAEAERRLSLVLRESGGNPAAIIAVCEVLSDRRPAPPALLTPLLELLGSDQQGVEAAISQAMAAFDPAQVLEHLAGAATNGQIPISRRLAAIRVLGSMGEDIEAVRVLASLLDVSDETVKTAALAAFCRATGLSHSDKTAAMKWWGERQAMSAVEWLRSVNRRQAEQLRVLLEQTSSLTARLVVSYRESYRQATKEDRAAKLLAFLNDTLPEVRRLGLDLINALITDRKDVGQDVKDRLIVMISDPDAGVRLEAARMVGDLRLTMAVAPLLEALGREPDYRVRVAQVKAIGRLDGQQAVPSLLRGLDEEIVPVVTESASALATIARRERDKKELCDQVASSLLARFRRIAGGDAAFREGVLGAMAVMGHESFRAVFKEEVSPDRPVALRRVAISGLLALGDASAADDIGVLVGAPEPEIRLAAVEALGRCGRREKDLTVLAAHLDPAQEADAGVRERSWDGYLSIAQRLAPQAHLKVAMQIGAENEKIAQRRRVDLLRVLTTDAQRFKLLSQAEQMDALGHMADMQRALGEYSASAGTLELALALVVDPGDARIATLRMKRAIALVRSRDDGAAMKELGLVAEQPAEAIAPGLWGSAASEILDDTQARLEAAQDARTCVPVLLLLEAAEPVIVRAGGPNVDRLRSQRAGVISKHADVVSHLLDAYAQGQGSGATLRGFGASAVLAGVYERLVVLGGGEATDAAAEERLQALAKGLCPEWSGYAAGCSPEERAAALERLKAVFSPVKKSDETPAPSMKSVAPTSQPAA